MIQVIERCFTILAKVAEDPQRIWSISEMAALIDVQPATCFHIVNSMVELGYMERIGMRRGYRLGPAVNGLCHNFAYRPELVRLADSPMRQFAREQKEGVVLAVLQGTKRYVICEAKPDQHHKLQVNYNLTVIEDVYYTATGLLLLAHCTRQEQEKFLASSGQPGEALWPAVRTREDFFRELEVLAGRPMLIRDWYPTLVSVAFPVFDQGGQFIAALGSYIPAYRFEGEHRENVLAGLYGITRVIQETLPAEGGFPPENQEFSARGQKYFV